MNENLSDFHALDPFFRIIEQGLAGFVDGNHFFDLLAEDVVFDFIITVPNYPRHIIGRANLIELYRGYGSTFFLDRCYDLRIHHSPSTSSVVLEYSSEGKVVATGQPYDNRYISVVVITNRKISAWRDYLDPLRVFAALEGRPFEQARLMSMLHGAVTAFQRWQYRGGRPGWSARISNRLGAIAFAAGIGPNRAATLEVRGHKTGRKISFPVVVADYQGDRYLVAMLGQKTNWVRNLRADNHAALLQRKRENVSLVEDFSGNRAAILRRYLELAAGARPFFPIDRRAPLSDFERIVNEYPVFRVT